MPSAGLHSAYLSAVSPLQAVRPERRKGEGAGAALAAAVGRAGEGAAAAAAVESLAGDATAFALAAPSLGGDAGAAASVSGRGASAC